MRDKEQANYIGETKIISLITLIIDCGRHSSGLGSGRGKWRIRDGERGRATELKGTAR